MNEYVLRHNDGSWWAGDGWTRERERGLRLASRYAAKQMRQRLEYLGKIESGIASVVLAIDE